MEQINTSVFGLLIGLALLTVGAGIRVAYGSILPYAKNPGQQTIQPPAPVVQIFMRFLIAANACIVAGALLIGGALAFGQPIAIGSHTAKLPISLYYAAVLGLLLVILSYNVLRHRVLFTIEGDGHKALNDRITRVHANFTEYAPLGLALLITLEWAGAPAVMVHFGGAVFSVARYLHAWGYTHQELVSFGRIVGIQTTLFALSYMVLAAAYFLFLN